MNVTVGKQYWWFMHLIRWQSDSFNCFDRQANNNWHKKRIEVGNVIYCIIQAPDKILFPCFWQRKEGQFDHNILENVFRTKKAWISFHYKQRSFMNCTGNSRGWMKKMLWSLKWCLSCQEVNLIVPFWISTFLCLFTL